MKKVLSGLISATLLMASAAQATDIAANIAISGTLRPAEFSCSVALSESSVSILENSDTLIKQGDNATSPVIVRASVYGGAECDKLVEEGKIAYKFTGAADDADGTVLTNSLNDETAAKGVGIGIFNEQNELVPVNTGRISAQGGGTFGLQMVQLKNQEAVAGNINSTVTVQIERL
ncbi:fimbrial protein [Cronobacter sp. JZ38]|uniref:fimbrial protein n=1 Tax=Cronobacter sp. JZ38 TaxID=1906275 RepID=UPI00129F94E3|nr:fimbrial protein [Cronobacter sp. JZ38]